MANLTAPKQKGDINLQCSSDDATKLEAAAAAAAHLCVKIYSNFFV